MEIGALWKRTSQKGEPYLSGVINLPPFGQMQVAVFPNDRKQSDNHPDYRVVYSPPREKKAEEEEPPF
jgi:uncharacterized protein (DUF736 family)